MSLRIRQSEVFRLDWDPSITQPEESDTSHFEWAIDHVRQEDGDWCWAACLSNALSCVGRYIGQKEIVNRFLQNHGDTPELVDDDRIPSPQDVISLWRSYGFSKAEWRNRDEPIPFEDLASEIACNGPVQAELWHEGDEKNRHLVLLCGFRETTAGPMVQVSDPAALEPEWYRYDRLQGPDPLPSGFGAWRRTYLDLGYHQGYLRRFLGRPTKYLARLPGNGDPTMESAPVPEVAPVSSSLYFRTAPDPVWLRHELTLGSHGYRYYRYRSTAAGEQREARREEMRQSLFLYETIPVQRLPFEVDLDADLYGQLRPYRWHHQIHDSQGRPRYYAHAYHFQELGRRYDRAWHTAWMGERWLAERVDAAIRKLDSEHGSREEEVWMVWMRRFRLTALLLDQSRLYFIVSSPGRWRKDLPLLQPVTDEELRAALERL